MEKLKIDFLDHVAIRVTDLKRSERWYSEVLGLERYQLPEWGPFPIFMLTGKTGIALFPASPNDAPADNKSKHVKIDHFAFRVDKKNFERAKQRYEQLGLDYEFQDHHYFHSIYTRDPDGHIVELTCLVVDEASFYK